MRFMSVRLLSPSYSAPLIPVVGTFTPDALCQGYPCLSPYHGRGPSSIKNPPVGPQALGGFSPTLFVARAGENCSSLPAQLTPDLYADPFVRARDQGDVAVDWL
jgi:hypothetical protein